VTGIVTRSENVSHNSDARLRFETRPKGTVPRATSVHLALRVCHRARGSSRRVHSSWRCATAQGHDLSRNQQRQ